jgi:peptidoglycan/xylan/chitin deacetylase (PgdA/CDA1 family)
VDARTGRGSVAIGLVGAALASGCWAGPTTPAAPEASITTAASPVTTTAARPPTTSTTAAPTGPATVVSRGDPSRPVVALTFDAGADTGFTAQILDTLAAESVPATFGLTGAWAEANPDLVRRIGSTGHQLVNHTWDHRSFTGVSARPAVQSAAERRDQLDRTEALIARLAGRTTRPWFRPPYGDYDASVNADVGAAGYRYNVLWTVDSLGWQGLSPAAITARCLERAANGAIYLFHVGAASQDAAALPGVIAGLRRAGYSFATVADVLAS